MSRSTPILKLGWVFLLALNLGGCFQPKSSPKNFQLPLPSKDEVARVNGRSFTLSDFVTLRNYLGSSHNKEGIFWIGVATLLIEEEAFHKGKQLRHQSALEIARYSSGDTSSEEAYVSLREYFSDRISVPSQQEVRREIENLLGRSQIQKNLQTFAQID